MRFTVKHFYDFQNAVDAQEDLNPACWDALRLNNSADDNMFGIPTSSAIWRERILANLILQERVKAILNLMQGRFSRLNSYGIGSGGIEFLIKREAPHIFVEGSDCAPKTVERLRGLFKEADRIIQFNILNDEWVNDGPCCLYLFHRIDTEFDDQQWRIIFEKIWRTGIEYILFIPSEFLTFGRLVRQKIKLLLYMVLGRRLTFAGYLRTKEQFFSFFFGKYKVEQVCKIGDLEGLFLKKIG